MSQSWQAEEKPASALNASSTSANADSQPVLGQQGTNAKFVGRVVVELWETSAQDDARSISIAPSAVDGDNATLVERIAAALPKRLQSAQTQGKRLFQN